MEWSPLPEPAHGGRSGPCAGGGWCRGIRSAGCRRQSAAPSEAHVWAGLQFKKRPLARYVFVFTACRHSSDRSARDRPSLAAMIRVRCSTLATSGRNDAPHASPFAERSAPNAVRALEDGGPSRVRGSVEVVPPQRGVCRPCQGWLLPFFVVSRKESCHV